MFHNLIHVEIHSVNFAIRWQRGKESEGQPEPIDNFAELGPARAIP
jgi:hypothetical protein